MKIEDFSRRDFLKTSGALVVTFSAASVLERTGLAQGQFGTRASLIDPSQVDSWLAIAADGTVTAYTGKCELGQGILTAQTQLVAEELSVPLDRVTLIMCDTQVSPDQGTTSGSQIPFNISIMQSRPLTLMGSGARSRRSFAAMMHMAHYGGLRGVVGQTFDLADAAKAHGVMAGRDFFGKRVLRIP